MSQRKEFTIDLNETFPHPSRAPIVEAVIHWQTAGGKVLVGRSAVDTGTACGV